MAGEIYSRMVPQGQQGALLQHLNFKKAFMDAQRQAQVEAMQTERKAWLEQQNEILGKGISSGQLQVSPADMATGGGNYGGFNVTADPTYNTSVNSEDRTPPGMEISGYRTSRQGKQVPYYKKSSERVALMGMDAERGKRFDNMADSSLGAIDSLNSLKQSYYEGFSPVDIKVDSATLFDTTGAKLRGFEKKIESALGKNPAARAYLTQLKGFATTISRGGFAEKGTLTDTDRKVVVDMFNLALANKEEAEYAFGTLGEILAKPSLRSGLFRMQKFQENYNDTMIPQEIKAKIDVYVQEGYTPEEAINYLLNKKYSK